MARTQRGRRIPLLIGVFATLVAVTAFHHPIATARLLLAPPTWHAAPDQASTAFGVDVARGGDIKNNGYGSVVVGASSYTHGQLREGAAFLWQSDAAGMGVTGNPGNADWRGESNQAATSSDANVLYGSSVAGVGDVNGDGFEDVLVGAPYYSEGNFDNGKVFLYLGTAGGLPTTPAWSARGDRRQGHFGASVAAAGDINGDGFADILVGEPSCAGMFFDCPDAMPGRVFLWLGGAGGMGPSGTPANADWVAEFAGLFLMQGLAGIGDVNNDTYDDIAVGAPWASNGQGAEGIVYVWLGSAAGLGAPGTSTNADWTAESNQLGGFLGRSVAGGDVNGDGLSDLIAGASGWDNPQLNEGGVFLWLGSTAGLGASGTPVNAVWRAEGNQVDAIFGWSVDVLDDFNGDGYGDVLVGSYKYTNGQDDEGGVFVWHGGPDEWSGTAFASAANWKREGGVDHAYFGHSAADAGDLNADGATDIVVGAYYHLNASGQRGRAWVFFGTPPSPGIVWIETRQWPPFIDPIPELCMLHLSGPAPIPDLAPRACPPAPTCPDCARAFGLGPPIDSARALEVTELYASIAAMMVDSAQRPGTPTARSVRRSATRGVRINPSSIERVRRAVSAVMLTSDLSKAFRDSALRQLDVAARSGYATEATLRALSTLLNAADVQSRVTDARSAEVGEGNSGPLRVAGMTLRYRGVSKAGAVTGRVEPGLPARSRKITTAWPVAHFVLEYSGALSKTGAMTIDLDMRSLGFDPSDRDVRLLEWDGMKYRDITVHVDADRGTIRGLTDRPRTYVVAKLAS